MDDWSKGNKDVTPIRHPKQNEALVSNEYLLMTLIIHIL